MNWPRPHKQPPFPRDDLSVRSYTTPGFEETTLNTIARRARAAVDEADKLLKQANAKFQETRDWVALGDELIASGASSVADLPEDRQEYWKQKLHRPMQVRYF